MSKPRRLLPLLGGGAAALLASFAVPMAFGHADPGGPGGNAIFETCDGTGVCLVQDPNDLSDWHYEGVRPLVTDWQGTQPYTVEANGTDLGSYNITAQDVWTPFYSVEHYTYGDFTPSAAGSSPDLGGFAGESGAQVYDVSIFGGAAQELNLNNVMQHGHELTYEITKLGDFTNTNVIDTVDGTSADYIQSGTSAPEFLYNSLFHSFLPVPPDYLVPSDAFAAPDFNPVDFFAGGVGTGGLFGLGDLSSIASLFGL
jgi:hypothetical protein